MVTDGGERSNKTWNILRTKITVHPQSCEDEKNRCLGVTCKSHWLQVLEEQA